jgi:hypothetical protein
MTRAHDSAEKFQISNAKSQKNSNRVTEDKGRTRVGVFDFQVFWRLNIGVWDLRTRRAYVAGGSAGTIGGAEGLASVGGEAESLGGIGGLLLPFGAELLCARRPV